MSASVPDPSADPAHALILGAGPGLGAAIAHRFAVEHARLTLVARDEGHLAAVAGRLRRDGARVREVPADAGDPYALRSALAPIVAVDPPGVLVANAAASTAEDLLTSDGAELSAAYSVGIVGTIVAVQLVAPGMRIAGSGTVLITDRIPAPGTGGTPTGSLTTATLRALAQRLAEQLADVPVRVETVAVPAGDVDPADLAERYWAAHAASVRTNRAERRVGAARR